MPNGIVSAYDTPASHICIRKKPLKSAAFSHGVRYERSAGFPVSLLKIVARAQHPAGAQSRDVTCRSRDTHVTAGVLIRDVDSFQ